jgi:hypothetical protein
MDVSSSSSSWTNSRRIREAEESAAWAAAAADPDFRREIVGVEAAYDSADRDAWPRP